MDEDSGDIKQVSSDLVAVKDQTNSTGSGSPNRSHGRRLTEIKPSISSLRCVSFHDIRYEITQRKCLKNLPKKVILNSISGLMLPGINAIMGPTGGGKTSLLDVLADRKSKNGLSGIVLVNGQKIMPNFKTTVGYVVQDDLVMGTLTVRENLHFSAALRLPSHMTHKQRKERVEGVICELGLIRCANTKVGTEFIRGVSGGERKRTNIGMELIIEPQVLFLDEPTTGLDAFTAVAVVQVLKELHDRIVILSIHQPRYSIFKLFDTLTLLSLGNLVYQGSSHKALEYFERHGYVCEEHENPADYFLDVINHCQENREAEVIDTERQSRSSEVIHHVDLVASYRQSTEYHELHNVIDSILLNQKNGQPLLRVQKVFRYLQPTRYSTNFIFQLLVLILRSAINLFRNPFTSVVQILIMIVFALIVGVVYLRLDQKEVNLQTVISDRLGAFFFIALTQVFGNLSAVDLFIKQKALFIHENASGFYRVSAFYFSKIFTDLILLRIIPLILFSVIVYFMVGFTVDASKFFIFFLTLALTSIAAASLAFAISALVSVTAVAIVVLALSFILSMGLGDIDSNKNADKLYIYSKQYLFGGFLIALSTLPDWLQWLKFLSIFRYAIEALSINEISGQCYCMAIPSNLSTFTDNITNTPVCFKAGAVCLSGSDALSSRGYETSTAWLWYDQIGLTCIALIFLALAYINLRLVKKDK